MSATSPDPERLATSLVSFAILGIAGAFLLGGGLLVWRGTAAFMGVLLFLLGVGVLAGAFFFNLTPLVARAYEPARLQEEDVEDGDA